MTWRVAGSLETVLSEINEAHPGRSKASDGSIGDTSHQATPSDHNPNSAGVVRARDFTHDPAHGFNCDEFAGRVAALLGKHPALGSGAYVIWDRRIISTDRLTAGWRTYTGSNPHDKHCHVSVQTSAPGYDSTTPWGVATEEDPMADYAGQLERIEKKIDAAAAAAKTRDQGIREADRNLAKATRALIAAMSEDISRVDDKVVAARKQVIAAIAKRDAADEDDA